ncbi:MAG: dinitrogenase iron-molybdenum cofactor biosynthesis protein [Aquificae bacterium]|nr:dinitrogenase iron-molybdenum cofactor biosynthesis protein [Aquificota bacterium]
MKVAVPVKELGGERSEVFPGFGKAPAFALFDAESEKVEIVPNPAGGGSRCAGRSVVRTLKERGVEAVLLKEVGKGALNHLRRAGVEVYLLPREVKTAQRAFEAFKSGKLKALEPREGGPARKVFRE